MFHFLPGERRVVNALSLAVRKLLSRDDVTPRQIHHCGVLLHAIQRLPLVTPEVGLSLSLIQPNESERFWIGVTIDGERFEFETGRSVHSDAGLDNESQSVFLVSTDGRSENRPGNVAGWLDMFQWMCEAAETEVDFDDFGAVPDWHHEGNTDWWSHLPASDKES